MEKPINRKIADVLHAAAGHPSDHPCTLAVIAAAGSSRRMGGLDKLLYDLCGTPVLVRTLKAYEEAATVDAIYIVTRSENMDEVRNLVATYGIHKVEQIVTGGQTRQESVRNAIDEVGRQKAEKRFKYIAIADGARCLTTPEQIDTVNRAAYRYEAATAATKATDTIKRANDQGFIEETLDREYLWQAQTPQSFRYSLYMAAAYTAERDGFEATDDNSLVEHVDHPVRLVDCGRENIKITTPVDLLLASAILSSRKEAPCASDKDTTSTDSPKDAN